MKNKKITDKDIDSFFKILSNIDPRLFQIVSTKWYIKPIVPDKELKNGDEFSFILTVTNNDK
jgi:hypothetical protein